MKGSFVAGGSTGETLIPTAFTAAGFKEAEGGLSVITGRRWQWEASVNWAVRRLDGNPTSQFYYPSWEWPVDHITLRQSAGITDHPRRSDRGSPVGILLCAPGHSAVTEFLPSNFYVAFGIIVELNLCGFLYSLAKLGRPWKEYRTVLGAVRKCPKEIQWFIYDPFVIKHCTVVIKLSF